MRNASIINVLLSSYVICFLLDSVVNQYVDIPILNIYLILQLTVMIAFFAANRKISISVLFVFISLLLSVLISSLWYGLDISDISDFLYLGNFIFFTGLLFRYYHQTSFSLVNYSFIIAVLLFLPTFFGYDGAYKSNLGSDSNDLEYIREYHAGFYRVPHIASYFFSFFFLVYMLYFQISKKTIYLVIALISISFSLYVGSRAMVFAIMISAGLYMLKKHRVVILPLAIAAIIGLFAILDWLLVTLQGTIAFQYFSFFQTLSQNSSRLSRFIIWNSWYQEMNSFKFVNYLFGKSFSESMSANFKNIGMEIWFHNDILSIIFSYGFITLFAYLFFLHTIYRKNQIYFSKNIYVFSFFISLLLASVFNGLYFYHTTIITYIFFFMIKILTDAHSYSRHEGYSK